MILAKKFVFNLLFLFEFTPYSTQTRQNFVAISYKSYHQFMDNIFSNYLKIKEKFADAKLGIVCAVTKYNE
jgi:hypothetical protein